MQKHGLLALSSTVGNAPGIPGNGDYDPNGFGIAWSDLLFGDDTETTWAADGANQSQWNNTGLESANAVADGTSPKRIEAISTLNNRGGVRFADAVNDGLLLENTNLYTKPMSMVIVCSHTKGAGFRYAVDGGNVSVGKRIGLVRRTAGQWAMYAGSNADLDSDTNVNVGIFALEFVTDPDARGYQNGTTYTGRSPGSNNTIDDFRIGGVYDGGSSGISGQLDVAMVAMTEQALLSNGNFASFIAATAAYYGISV